MDPIQNKKSFGPIVGVVVIVIALLVGIFYFWNTKALAPTEILPTVSSSDTVDSIQQDLSSGSGSSGAIIDTTDIENSLK